MWGGERDIRHGVNWQLCGDPSHSFPPLRLDPEPILVPSGSQLVNLPSLNQLRKGNKPLGGITKSPAG